MGCEQYLARYPVAKETTRSLEVHNYPEASSENVNEVVYPVPGKISGVLANSIR